MLNMRGQPRGKALPANPENGDPDRGCWDGPRGCWQSGWYRREEANNTGKPATGQKELGTVASCPQLHPCSRIASCCLHLLPSASNFSPFPLTTHGHASKCAHRRRRRVVHTILLTSCPMLISFLTNTLRKQRRVCACTEHRRVMLL